MKLILFCEAAADQRMAASLMDRVLCEDGPAWVSDLMDMNPKHVREWSNDDLQRSYFDLHAIDKYLLKYKVRPPLGHFDGKPGSAGAQMAETEDEKLRLATLRKELGFCPVREAHLAKATEHGAKKNPKRIADVLLGNDPERRSRCLTLPLDELRTRGVKSGLTDFLNELREHLLPLLTQPSR